MRNELPAFIEEGNGVRGGASNVMRSASWE
jgi:hypothetical protein